MKGLLAATLFFLFANLATDLVYGPNEERPAWMTDARTYPLLNASGRAIVDWVEARRSVLGPVDRLLGGGFGMLKGLIGATLFFLLANLATDMIYGGDADRPKWMTESRTYPLLNATGRGVVDWVETRRKKDGDEQSSLEREQEREEP